MSDFFWYLADAVSRASRCLRQAREAINFGGLRTNCIAAVESGQRRGPYSDVRFIQVMECKLLAWYRQYRIRNSRYQYDDNTLCWCKMSSDHGILWALVHMVRFPEPTGTRWRGADCHWHHSGYNCIDGEDGGLVFFEQPPKNEDVYSQMTDFKFKADRRWGWETYDSRIISKNWLSALGEKPTKEFSNQ